MPDMRETLHGYHREYGYNPHSLVAISERASGWEASCAHGAVSYLAIGRTWLAAEPLAADADLAAVAAEFLAFARRERCLAVFLPATERFARAGVAMGLDCVALGRSPYFDLQTWTREGRKLHTVRKELRKAERAGVTMACVPGAELPRGEAEELARQWIASRRTTGLGWVFAPDTFNFPGYQKHFLARDAAGRLVGLLSAAPLPARRGYYFKDLHRHPNAPQGTADVLMVGAMEKLRGEGARLTTPGAVPIYDVRSPEALSRGRYAVSRRLLELIAERGERFYGFAGLRTFKVRFAPTWWEFEYAVGPRAPWAGLRTGIAMARAALPGGLLGAVRKTAFGD